MVAIGNARFHSNFNVVSMLELEGPVTLALVQEAALRVQQQHACLRVEVAELGGEWVFRETEQLIRVELLEGRDWRAAWAQMIRGPLDALAWRLSWVPGLTGGQLVVAFHHSISDITSLAIFFRSLLAALDDAHRGANSRPEPIALHAPLTRAVGARWPLRAMARMGWHRCSRRLRAMPLDSAAPVALTDRRWSGPFEALGPDAVRAIVERSRAEQVTLGHAISAAMLLEVADRVRLREGPRGFDLTLNTSLDLRRYEPKRLDCQQMGLGVAVVETRYRPRATDDVWSLARRVKGEVDAVKTRGEHRDFALLPQLIGPRIARWVSGRNEGRPAAGALVISNFGRLGTLRSGAFSGKRIFFTAAQPSLGATLLFASCTLDDTMYVHLGHPSPALSEETGRAVLDGILQRVGAR